MRKILLIGNAPLPHEQTKIRPAAGLRTWQFMRAVEGKGFEAKVLLIEMGGGSKLNPGLRQDDDERSQDDDARRQENMRKQPEDVQEHMNNKGARRYDIIRIAKNEPGMLATIQKIHDEFQPEAIISVNTYPSFVASQLQSRAPLWADLNGWIMAEAQAQAYKMESNDYLQHYYKMERAILKRADKFSTVSERQKLAMLGELAFVGRLNKESFGYAFGVSIANGMEGFEGEETRLDPGPTPSRGQAFRQDDKVRRQDDNNIPKDHNSARQTATDERCRDVREIDQKLPKEAFVLLWMGGYNTWVDEMTLFKGVAAAMRKCEKLYFVSTGGELEGLDNRTFAKFKKMIEESELRERFIFLGWVESASIPYIYRQATAGINVDRKCAETLTGARNRITEMMKFGVPVITTLGTEVAGEVEKIEAGITVTSGKSELLAEAIVKMYEEWRKGGQQFKDYGRRGREYIEQHCNYEVLMQPLLKWLENPRPAPDRGVKINFGWWGRVRAAWRYLRENGWRKVNLRKL